MNYWTLLGVACALFPWILGIIIFARFEVLNLFVSAITLLTMGFVSVIFTQVANWPVWEWIL